MIRKIIQYAIFLKKVNIIQFIYLNYFCQMIIRTDNSKIIPYKNAVIEINRNAKIYLGGGDIEIGCELLKKSKTETYVRLRDNAIWSSSGGCKIAYGSTLEALENALFCNKYFTMNSNSVIIAAKKIQFGQDVMIGRNVVIYDSDHHIIRDEEGNISNFDAPVIIGDHVWLATNVTVLKGAVIGTGSVIAANAVVYGNVSSKSIYRNTEKVDVKKNYGSWERQRPK